MTLVPIQSSSLGELKKPERAFDAWDTEMKKRQTLLALQV
jgi:hypothetical protein